MTVVSFLFFLGTLVAFYVRQQIGYFFLSTAFLIVYVFTLIGWLMQKRNVIRVYENGIRFKRFKAEWREITSVKADKTGLQLSKGPRETVLIPPSVIGFDQVIRSVRDGVEGTQHTPGPAAMM